MAKISRGIRRKSLGVTTPVVAERIGDRHLWDNIMPVIEIAESPFRVQMRRLRDARDAYDSVSVLEHLEKAKEACTPHNVPEIMRNDFARLHAHLIVQYTFEKKQKESLLRRETATQGMFTFMNLK